MTRYVPIIHWLPRYHRRWWRGDVIAGGSVWALTRNVDPPVQAVVLDLGTTYYADLDGTDVLRSIKKGLGINHIKFHLAEAPKEVLNLLETTGVDQVIGRANIYQSVDEAVQAFLSGQEGGANAQVEREHRSTQ